MPKQKQKEITLDEILTKKRRAEASRKATEIMGAAARRSSNPNERIVKGQDGSAILPPPASGSGVGAAATGKWKHDPHSRANPDAYRVSKGAAGTRVSPAVAKQLQGNRLFAALHGDQVEVRGVRGAAEGSLSILGQGQDSKQRVEPAKKEGALVGGFQIRGVAGPAVVQASNFAPGTTAEDIRHAMQPLGKILSCIILIVTPSVIAEIVFETKQAGDKCIQQYNGQKADGRTLIVQFKDSPPIAPVSAFEQQLQLQARSRDPFVEREEADRRRREQNIHFQDGRFGLKPPPMYSDALLQRGRGFEQ